MPTPAPDQKLQEYAVRLGDKSRPISEIEIRGIMRDLDATKGYDHSLDGLIFNLRAICYLRLNRPDRAATEIRLALQRIREPGEWRSILLCNQSAAFLMLGRFKEAAESSLEAATVPHPGMAATLGNLAEALVLLGDRDRAFEVFEAAVEAADFREPAVAFAMAFTAVAIGSNREAVEFFARFVELRDQTIRGDRTAIEVIREASGDVRAVYERTPGLLRAIRRAAAFEDERAQARVVVERSSVPPDDDGAQREAAAVFEATKSLRTAAAEHVLRDQDATS